MTRPRRRPVRTSLNRLAGLLRLPHAHLWEPSRSRDEQCAVCPALRLVVDGQYVVMNPTDFRTWVAGTPQQPVTS